MKPFLVFAYEFYDSCGGLEDCQGDFDTLEEAQECAQRLQDFDYVQIWDIRLPRESAVVWQNP